MSWAEPAWTPRGVALAALGAAVVCGVGAWRAEAASNVALAWHWTNAGIGFLALALWCAIVEALAGGTDVA